MTGRRTRIVAATAAAGALAGGVLVSAGSASEPGPLDLTPVPSANTKAPGYAPPNVLSPQLRQTPVVQGSVKLENGTAAIPYYGYDGDGPMVPLAGSTAEATKTEPDKNTYLMLGGQHGADPSYGYGRHFLYQGHEHAGPSASGYITRVNLDADGAHRVTMLADHDSSSKPLPAFDGSTWDPFARRLLFTAEDLTSGGVWQATPDFPSTVDDMAGSLGRGGYEGIQNDSDGNLWIVEDVGGKAGATSQNAKQPNSFVYRFKPRHREDLSSGKLQVLQVTSLRTGQPIVFHDGQAEADITSPDTQDLHTYGHVFKTRWVTIHDTATDGNTAVQRERARQVEGRDPVQATGERRVQAGLGLHAVLVHGDRRHQLADRGRRRGWRLRWRAGAQAVEPVGRHRHAAAALPGRRAAHGTRQHPVRLEGRGGGCRGRRRRAAHAAQRARLGLPARHPRQLRGAEPAAAGALARRGPRPVGDDRLGAGRSVHPPGSATTATTRSPASTSRTATRPRAASSARAHRSCSVTTAAGGRSGPSSTATTGRGSCSRRRTAGKAGRRLRPGRLWRAPGSASLYG